MKKTLTILLVLAVFLSFSACGKSDAAKAVDATIEALGEITLDSEADIIKAEEAVNALAEEDRKQLDRTDDLAEARATYEALVQAKIDAENQAEAAKIDELIDLIGTVTLESKEAIETARTEFDASKEDIQKFVQKLDVLETAETDYAKLKAAEIDKQIDAIGEVTLEKAEMIDSALEQYQALTEKEQSFVAKKSDLDKAVEQYGTLKIQKTIDLINAIGTVTKDSGDAITAARTAYDALSEEDVEKVSNVDVLTAAETKLKQAKKEYGESLLKSMWSTHDEVRGLSFYHPSVIPHGNGMWYTDERSFVLPYIGRSGNNYYMRLLCNYTGDDWIFFEKITFAVDDERYHEYFSYYDIVRDNDYGDVWEYADYEVSGTDIDMLWEIVNSTKTIVRFEGDEYHYDHVISASDKQAIKNILLAYEAIK